MFHFWAKVVRCALMDAPAFDQTYLITKIYYTFLSVNELIGW